MTARTANCPSCGGPLRFRGATSIVAVCAFCRSTLVRDGARLEDIGKQAELIEDESPLRIGAAGRHRGASFDVVGRIQYRYGAGVWNEWHVLFAHRKGAWLSDAGRRYTITYLEPSEPVPAFDDLSPGQVVALQGKAFTVTNKESAEVIAGEGELPFRFRSGWNAPVADLRGEGNAFATLDYSEDPPHVYLGERLPFDAFGFTGLRDANAPGGFARGRALAFKCGGCGAPVEKHLATTEVVACASCGTVTDVTAGVGEIVQRHERHAKAYVPSIPLGTEGTWKGIRYEVVGLLRRAVTFEGASWEWTEYLLHNVEHGYAWVSEYQGHFSVIHDAAELPKPMRHWALKRRVKYLGHAFTHFQRAEAKVTYLAGEFPWRVKLGDTTMVDDYVAPPLILSSERTDDELTWSFGEYAPGPELWKAFGLPGKPPHPVGVAANQPSPHAGSPRRLWKAFLAFAVLGLALQLLLAIGGAVRKPGALPFVAVAGETKRATSPVFTVGGWADAPVTAKISSDAATTWLVLNLQLTNAETGQAWAMRRQLGLTVVNGVQQGSTQDMVEFPSVPPGRYTLTVDAQSGKPAPGRDAVRGTIEAYRSKAGWGNFWLFLGFLVLWPLAAWFRANAFETRRWAESDYAPTPSASDDEDDE